MAGPSGSNSNRPDYSAILGDIEIPEGVDPSFLAALPEEMRQEVIAEQLRFVFMLSPLPQLMYSNSNRTIENKRKKIFL